MLSRRVGMNGIMDYHLSKELKAIQIIGSVSALDRGPHSLLAKSGSGFLHSGDAVELGMVERGQAIALCFDVQSQIPGNHVFIQASHLTSSHSAFFFFPARKSLVVILII